jgi:plasmid stabilization system protein ParE
MGHDITGFENYLIFYRPLAGGGIEIIRVLHGAQDVDRIVAQGY